MRALRAWVLPRLVGGTCLALLSAICVAVDQQRMARLSQSDLAQLSGLSPSCARQALQDLEGLGAVERLEAARGNRAALYRVNPPRKPHARNNQPE